MITGFFDGPRGDNGFEQSSPQSCRDTMFLGTDARVNPRKRVGPNFV
jgi:hypothetical protein